MLGSSYSSRLLLALVALTLPANAVAHEVPAHVAIRAFAKPEGERLRLLVRVPLEAMRDVEFPLHGPGFLDLARADATLRQAAQLWLLNSIGVNENGSRLNNGRIAAVRASLPSDLSFAAYDDALAHLTGPPLPPDTQLPWQQAMLDVLLEYPTTSENSQLAIEPALASLGMRTTTVLRVLLPDGKERALVYSGDPGVIRLDPRWYQTFAQFVKLGFRHILSGIDHLLFLLCLVIPFRRLRPLVLIVTAFTVAHSITLVASARGFAPSTLWFAPLIETLIALSIVYMALENIVGAKLQRRWWIAFGFGLVHGFGFSFVLRDSLQFAGSHLATSLLAFNIGVELGQLLLVVLAVPVLELMFRKVIAERVGTIILSVMVAHTAWHWLGERANTLRAYRLNLPAFDASLIAGIVRALLLALIVAPAVWLMLGAYRRYGAGAGNLPATRNSARWKAWLARSK